MLGIEENLPPKVANKDHVNATVVLKCMRTSIFAVPRLIDFQALM